jgi:branched-chain amino acid transport system permease protein
VGSGLLHYAAAELGRDLPYWRGLLGLVIMLVMVASPSGLLSLAGARRRRPGGAGA